MRNDDPIRQIARRFNNHAHATDTQIGRARAVGA